MRNNELLPYDTIVQASSIDLKSYIASAKKTNQEIIENAGTQINAKTSEYMSTGKAFRGDSYEDL